MPAYLVRTIDDHDLVGFFYADEMDELLIIIDECLDPVDCEYIELPAGGIYWESPAVPVPLEVKDGDIDPNEPEKGLPWACAELSESWFSAVDGQTDRKWIPFFPDAPRAPTPEPSQDASTSAQVIPMRRRRPR